MKKYEIEIQDEVYREIEAIYRWIRKDNPIAAAHWYNGCIDAFESLKTFPARCPIAPESDFFSEKLRHLIYKPFRIIFTIRSRTVHVLHVTHGARDLLWSKKPE